MSERTTIGGTVYESIGSSSSNLLLKCNGTARIQWGNRLIDLIKNGKIASGDSSTQIYVISDESEIKSDGVYVLSKEESLQLWICKDDEQYNITNADLYISAKTKQDITVEQRQQALENIGMYYNTLEDVQQAGIQNGLVYVLSDQNLYTIRDGIVTEFEAKLKTVTVEKEEQEGEIITSDVKIVLSVLNSDYVIIGQGQVLVNFPLYIKESVSIESENASETRGYRLYVDDEGSHLDVDNIYVRNGLPNTDYTEVTYDEFYTLLTSAQLKPHKWYVITDYRNPWKIPKNLGNVRPIMVQALTESTLYPEGKLFKDQRVVITYDPYYREKVNKVIVSTETSEDEIPEEELEELNSDALTMGHITQMIDARHNSANFDFMDYGTNEDPDIILHASVEDSSLYPSIFPISSYNNTLVVNDLYGTILVDGKFSGTSRINFKFEDQLYTQVDSSYEGSEGSENPDDETEEEVQKPQELPSQPETDVEPDGSEGSDESTEVVTYETMEMHDNYIVCNGFILDGTCTKFCNNIISQISASTPIKTNITNSKFDEITGNTTIACDFDSVKFQKVHNCTFGEGLIQNLICSSDLTDFTFNVTNNPLLYESSSDKEMTVTENQVQLFVAKEQSFISGMIMMYSGLEENIPDGWAICDGELHLYNGKEIRTPNLIGQFIKGSNIAGDVGGAATVTLTTNNLPSHSHTYYNSPAEKGEYAISQGISSEIDIPKYSLTTTTTDPVGSGEAFSIEPPYYTLIFIMKL